MKIKEVIIVEGKNDTHRIKQAVEADTIETNGLGLTVETIELIKLAAVKRGIVVFTDPDFAGNKIRKQISDLIPQCKHAYLTQSAAKSKRENESVGIEHASNEAIRRALQHVQQVSTKKTGTITRKDLLYYGLIGIPEAKERRRLLGERLHIGYANAKQLLIRLQMFDIPKDELNRVMMSILEGENDND